jgi:hypothetical protein
MTYVSHSCCHELKERRKKKVQRMNPILKILFILSKKRSYRRAARGGAGTKLCRELCRNQLEPDSPTILAPAIRRGPRVVAKIQQLVSGRRFSKDSERLPARFGERFIFSLHNSVRKRYHVFHCHRAYLFCLSPSRHIFL